MKKMTTVAIYTLTFVAVSMWAAASFAKGHQEIYNESHDRKLQEKFVDNVRAEKVISDIQVLAERLDGVLKTQETYGDAKMGPELESLQSEASSILTNKNNSNRSIYGRSAAEINLDVKTIEKRISELEQGVN